MNNITMKIIMSLVCCALVISMVLSWTAATNSKNVMREEVKKELLYASQKYANQFSAELQTQENVVDIIATTVSTSFTVRDYINSREKFIAEKNKLNDIIKITMNQIPIAKSLYLTFNPETSGANDEVWYIRNEAGKVFYMEADNTVEDWLDEGNGNNDYYFDTIKNGKTWSGVEYDVYLDTYSVTYASGCWDKDGQLIGVMGTDIFIDDIFDTVKNIQLNEGGYAFLMDSEYNYLAGSKSEEFFNKIKNKGVLNLNAGIDKKNSSNNFSYSTMDGEKYITTYANTSNGWILTLVQSEDNMLRPIENMNRILFVMAILIILAVSAYAIYFSRKSVLPIVREYEEKDIVMLHQSRQAKLGEMVANIAHQWKQPLNVMSITLSNLWDDYRNQRLTEKQLKEHIENMRIYIKNMSNTVDDFTDFLKPARKMETFPINKELDTALSLMTESINLNGISVSIEGDKDIHVCGSRNEFCQGLFNILSNARDAIIENNPDSKEINIKITANESDGPCVTIDIINNGSKIENHEKTRLFKPYYTTKEETGGTGLGLYLTKQIIEFHMGGTIDLFNVNEGVCCRIVMPREV